MAERLIELLCVSTIPDDDEICNNRVRKNRLFSWKRYDLFIDLKHAFHSFSKYGFLCEAHFFSSDFHIVAMSVYIFPSLHPNVYGVDVNRFVYADDDVEFYVSAFFGSATTTVFSIWEVGEACVDVDWACDDFVNDNAEIKFSFFYSNNLNFLKDWKLQFFIFKMFSFIWVKLKI